MSDGPKWKWVIVGGLLAGVVINVGEWLLHGVLLDRRWTSAFAALGRHHPGWSEMIIPGNFLVGGLTVWLYARLRTRYGPGPRTALRAGFAAWIIFWVIPTMAIMQLELFPKDLLFLVIAGGIINAHLPAVLGAWIYRGDT